MEPKIIINDQPLNNAQAMTMRVAVENFAMDLFDRREDENEIDKLYLERISEIREMMYTQKEENNGQKDYR